MKKTLHSGGFIRKLSSFHLLFALLLYGGSVSAQSSYVPDYTFSPTITGPYVPITTGPVLATGTVDDDTYTGLNIGFTFVYDNIPYTTFSLNANGYIRMGNNMDGNRSPVYDQIPNVLAPITEDLQGTNSGQIRYDTFGVAPNRKLVIQYKDWGFYNRNGDDSFDFQIVLHETSNAVDFIYGRFFKTGDDYVQVGITGNDGSYLNRITEDDWNATTAGSQWDYCFLSDVGPIVPYSGLTYTFAPPARKYNTSIVEGGPASGVGIGSMNQVVAKLKVSVDGIGSYLPVTAITVNTAGTTNLASVADMKVYYTGASPYFSATTQFGATTFSPGATNIVTDSINLATGDNYFWVTYDISASATNGQIVDASISSIVAGNTTQIPTVTSPSGNRTVSAPMSFVGATATQSNISKVARGTENNEILGITVVAGSTGAAINLTQFDFDATGTTDTSNIYNIKVWHTGNSKQFATGSQFGTTLANLPGSYTFTITGTQELSPDTNYFWLTYDIVDTSSLTNLVDAQCNSMIVDGAIQTPTETSPLGSREIKVDYCKAIVSNVFNSCNWGYYISAVVTSGAETNLTNYSGCNGNANNYIYYPNQTLVVKQNQNISIELGDYSSWITYGVWIDYNQDGVFDNITERVFQGSTIQNEGYVAGNFTIPCDALTGTTRMRIRGGDYWWWGAPIGDPCGDLGYGETEDYNIVILNNPIAVTSLEPDQKPGIASP